MARTPSERHETVEILAAAAIRELRAISNGADDDENRAHAVRAAVTVERLIRRLRDGASGRQVILDMLEAAHPDPVSADVLRHASGIQEFARRIRELREEGYAIESLGNSYRLDLPD